ncbi:hypothetical protein [Flexivirga sp. B27]
MSSSSFRRTLVGAVAIAGALGLTACNNDSASVTTPSGSDPAVTSQAPAPTQDAPETSSEAPTAEESTTTSEDSAAAEPSESSSETSSESSSEDSGDSAGADGSSNAQATPDGTKLKFGQAAVIDDDSDGKYKLKVKKIVAAPKAAYAAANLNESNGKMYYVMYDVTNLGGAKYGFRVTAPNQFFLKPVFDSSEKGRAGGAPTNDLPGGCNDVDYSEKIAVGETGSGCYYYQVTGDAPTKVMWDTYKIKIVWSK